MTLRSWLFVPGDSPAKIAKAQGVGADALILDLEDSVAEPNKAQARTLVAEALGAGLRPRRPQLWVRINPLSTPHALQDLAAVVASAPDGIVLPKPDSAADVLRLDHFLSALEAAAAAPPGAVKVMPIATETPRALFALDSYVGSSARLAALTWGAEDLPAAIGAATNRAASGAYTDICRLARSLTLAASAAAAVDAIETVYPDFRDLDGLRAYAAQGAREGFVGMMAIHPAQVEVINAVFQPSEAELDHARRVVAAFEAQPQAGTLSLDGRMIDAPHLKQARRILGA